MEEIEKNKVGSQSDINTKQSIISNDSNNTYNEKASDENRQVNHQKIKINEQKLKDAKEKTMEIKSESNKDQTISEDLNQKTNNLFIHEKRYYFQIKHLLRGKRKKNILIILLIIGLAVLFISLIDMINAFKHIFDVDNILNNNTFVFILQIMYIASLFIFQILIIISERRDNFLINLIFLFTICTLMILKIFLFIKQLNSKDTTIIHLIINFCITSMNIIILLITLRVIKMKKSEQQNIEEIINFTDIPQGLNGMRKIEEKKDNQLILNSSGTENKSETDIKNIKEGMTGFVEEINNKENNIDNNEQK